MSFSRREFLGLSGIVAAEAGVSACAPPPPTGPPFHGRDIKRACELQGGKKDPLWGADIRGDFRTLECMTGAMLALPGLDTLMGRDVKERFWKLHGKLAKYSYSRTIAETWRSFYELTSRLHEIRNERSRKSKLPVYAYNGHQHAARMWLDEAARRNVSGVLLHFDTHDDMRGLNRPGKIVSAVSRLKQGGKDRRAGLSKLTKLIHDHATPVSGGVLGRSVSKLVWAFPYWAYASEFEQRPCFYADAPNCRSSYGSFRLFHDRSEDTGGTLPPFATKPWLEIAGVPKRKLVGLSHKCPFHMTLVQTYPWGTEAERARRRRVLLAAIPRGGFLLDIDLDYFMSIDSSSGFHRRPPVSAGSAGRAEANNAYESRLRRGRRLLDKRLVAFENLLEWLRDNRRVPTAITLADSTYMPFASTIAGKSYWEYMPYEFAAYVHWKVRRILNAVYKSYGIDAGTS